MANLNLKSAKGEKIGYWEVTLEISSQGRLLHGNDMLCFSILGSDVTGIHTGCMNWQTVTSYCWWSSVLMIQT